MTAKHEALVFRLESSVTSSLCESIDTPRALSVYLLLKYKQWDELLRLECNSSHYPNAKAFRDDYQVTSMLQKNPRLPTGIDTQRVALDKFWEWERNCSVTNERLTNLIDGRDLPDRDILSCLEKAQAAISQILGPLTRTKLSFAESKMRFGPGATTSLSGVVTQGKKYSRRSLDATPRVLPFRLFGFPQKWRPLASDICLRRSSKMRTVPKNAKTDRTICIEPDLNIFVQLGTGALIRDQLLRSGLDLNTQSWNQYLASRAWELDLCTMDLSGASDSIARNLVWLLLPFDWADFLHFSRTDFVESDGREIELNKWSSMGNGYTFELETLIFYGILLGCCRHLGLSETYVTAYGDDLIFPVQAEDLVRRALSYFGFSVNRDKTFGKGVFHESCGTDWFMGQNVRPFFLRSDHHDFPTVCFIIANNLSSWALRHDDGDTRDARCLPAWLRCFTACPASTRHRIPSGFGDVGFISSFDEAHPSLSRFRESRGWSGYDFSFREIRATMTRISDEGCLLAFLNGNRTEFSLARESLRGRFRTAVTKRGYTLVWPHLGPWVNT